MDISLFYIPIDTLKNAQKLARELVSQDIVVCVNIIPQIRSFYKWEGKVEDSNEVLIISKVLQKKKKVFLEKVTDSHPYTAPAIIEINGSSWDPAFNRWATLVNK